MLNEDFWSQPHKFWLTRMGIGLESMSHLSLISIRAGVGNFQTWGNTGVDHPGLENVIGTTVLPFPIARLLTEEKVLFHCMMLIPVKDNSWEREVRISAPQTSTMLFTEPQLKNLRQLRLGWLCPFAGHMSS